MSISVGASFNALSYPSSVQNSGPPGVAEGTPIGRLFQTEPGGPPGSPQPPKPGGSSPLKSFDPSTLAALLSAQGQNEGSPVMPTAGNVFAALDSNGDGQVTKSEFENALGKAGVAADKADALFNKLDTDDNDEITQGELTSKHKSAAQGQTPHAHNHHVPGMGYANPLAAASGTTASDDGTTETVTNADGSTTTTTTYADGTTVDSTTPAAQSAEAQLPVPNVNDLLTQLMNVQASFLSPSSVSTLLALI